MAKETKDHQHFHPVPQPKAKKAKPKGIFSLFWYYLKEDEGPIGWILNILVAFILIKYILLPGLGWALGTSFPLVAVVSGSMEHHGAFDSWWSKQCVNVNNGEQVILQKDLYANQGIDQETFQDFKFRNGLNTGDLMIVTSPKNLLIGDVIVFNGNTNVDPIIHRIVSIDDREGQKVYKTKGDDNCGSSTFEQAIPPQRIIGKAQVRIPLLGYVKVYFEKLLRFIGLESAVMLFR